MRQRRQEVAGISIEAEQADQFPPDAIYVKRTVKLNIPASIALNLFDLATLNTLVLSTKIKYRSKLDSQSSA